jgi:hypothetical protein
VIEPRSYTLIDFTWPSSLDGDYDLVVRFTEYIRANFRTIVPGVPEACELDMLASGHAQNPGILPLLGLYSPPDVIERLPNWQVLIATVDRWCAALSDSDLQSILSRTNAPTWSELKELGTYPQRGAGGGKRNGV